MTDRTLLLVDRTLLYEAPLRTILPDCRIVAADGVDVRGAVRAHRPAVVAVPVEPVAEDGGEPEAAVAGLEALSVVLTVAPTARTIALARAEHRWLAVRAVARGVHEVCRLPPDPEEMPLVVERAFHRADLEREGRLLPTGADPPPTLRAVRDEAELRVLRAALARADGNLSAAARLLAVSRPTLYTLMRQHGLKAG